MIQRPQTIYFLAIAALALMMAFADISYFTIQNDSKQNLINVMFNKTIIEDATKAEEYANHTLVYFLDCVAIIAMVGLFMFKNRKLQMTLTSINFLFILACVYYMYHYSFKMDYVQGNSGSMSFNAMLPLALIFFNLLAMLRIRRDERLVRSMNRIR